MSVLESWIERGLTAATGDDEPDPAFEVDHPPETLGQLTAAGRHPVLSGESGVGRAARIYGEDGGGARDPRTGVSVPRLREVLRGELDLFFEAYRRVRKA